MRVVWSVSPLYLVGLCRVSVPIIISGFASLIRCRNVSLLAGRLWQLTFRIDIFFFTDRELFAEFVLGKDELYRTPGMSEWLKELGLADNFPCVKLEKGFESSTLLSASSRVLEKIGTRQLEHDGVARPSYISGLISIQGV